MHIRHTTYITHTQTHAYAYVYIHMYVCKTISNMRSYYKYRNTCRHTYKRMHSFFTYVNQHAAACGSMRTHEFDRGSGALPSHRCCCGASFCVKWPLFGLAKWRCIC